MDKPISVMPAPRGRPRKDLEYVTAPVSPLQRRALGERARKRRRDLGLIALHAAAEIGVSNITLGKWEREFPERLNAMLAKLWEDALLVPRGWLLDTRLDVPAPSLGVVEGPPMSTAAGEILAAASWLTRKSVKQRTFEFDRLTPGEKRQAMIFAMRYGVAPAGMASGKQTPAAVGTEFSLTRERIRQIVARMLERTADLSKTRFVIVDRLSDLILPLLPLSNEDLHSRLGALLGEVSIGNVDLFAREVLGRRILTGGDGVLGLRVADDEEGKLAGSVHDITKRMLRAAGAAHMHIVFGVTAQTCGKPCSLDEIARIVRILPGFEWLDEQGGWFWAGPDKGGRVNSVTMKILAASRRRVDAEEIMAGLTRGRRDREHANEIFYSVLPPISVVIAILKRTPWIKTIQHDDFQLRDGVPTDGVLSESESAIVGTIRAHGGVVSRRVLAKTLVDSGTMTNICLCMTLSGSPIVTQVSRAVYSIRGVGFDDGALKRTAAQAQSNGYSARFEEEGWLSCTIVLNKSICKNRVFAVPAAIAMQITPGSYRLDGKASEVNLVALSNGYRFNMLAKAIVDAGLVEGDTVRLWVHPEMRLVRFEKAGDRQK